GDDRRVCRLDSCDDRDSKRELSAHVDYVTALCTYRPSLLPIEWLSETLGSGFRNRQRILSSEKFVKL
ncbi:484_t:CDS:1, partial [Acaulospora morrowiae]